MHIAKQEMIEPQTASAVSSSAGAKVLLVHNQIDTSKRIFAALQNAGFDVEFAENSRRALAIMEARHHEIGVVVLDVGTATAEAYNLAETIHCSSDYRSLSVATLSDNNTAAARIYAAAGIMPLYSLTYPLNPKKLASSLQAAIADTQRKRDLATHVTGAAASFDILESCRFSVRTLQDVERSAYMAASCFSQPARAIHGLEELLLNAVEHGNLEIGHEQKFELLKSGGWTSEIQKRLESENFGARKVDFAVVKRDGGTSAVITDQGHGFDWQSIMNGTSESGKRIQGRGISRARLMSFDKIAFNDAGNRVVAFMRDTGELDW